MTDLSSKLETKDAEISKLQKTCNDLEQYSRRNCVRVFGIPEQKGEDTSASVCKLAKEKLGIDLQKSQIDRSHRVREASSEEASERSEGQGHSNRAGKPSERKPRQIIVKFVSYQTKKAVISARRKLKSTGISIFEDLTKSNRELLTVTRKHKKVISAWTSDGRVVALLQATGGKTITRGIRNENDLLTL